MTIVQLFQNRASFSIVKMFQDKKILRLSIEASITQFLLQILYLLSGQYTIISHATILSSFGGALIVVQRCICCILSVFDEVEKVNPGNQNIPFGDLCGILCSVFMAINMTQQHELIKQVPTSLAAFIMGVIGIIFIISYGLLFDTFTFDMNVETGVFGFCDKKYALYTFIVLGFFTGAISQVAESQSLKYYSPLIVINFQLFEPMISQLLSCWMGIDHAPGYMTYMGGVITVMGIFLVSYGGTKLEKLKKISISTSDSNSQC
eukprot:403356142